MPVYTLTLARHWLQSARRGVDIASVKNAGEAAKAYVKKTNLENGMDEIAAEQDACAKAEDVQAVRTAEILAHHKVICIGTTTALLLLIK
jgi:hypothetical protein